MNHILDVPASDPDDKRRSRLLNIILLPFAILTLVASVGTAARNRFVLGGTETLLVLVSIIFFCTVVFVYYLNRSGRGQVAAWIFLVILIAVIAFGDTPQEVVRGRSLFLFAIPILISSVVLPPRSSFVTAIIVDAMLLLIGVQNQISVELTILSGFMALAVISWLSARSLEQALRELRVINQELDNRVSLRTSELQEANSQLTEQAAALEVARDQALNANRFKSEMLAKVSHELRTPLGAILGYAEILSAELPGPVNERQREMINKIIGRNNDLTRLVADLLDQSQLDSGNIKIVAQPFSISELVEKVHYTLEPRAAEKGLELDVNIGAQMPDQIVSDPNRLEQVLTNLMTNAIKFTEVGSVSLFVQSIDDHQWQLQVIDTGIGIPEEDQSRIFEPFRQVDGSVTRNRSGFGLGLSIVAQLTAALGGTVKLESQVGEGTTFTVTLPLELPVASTDVVPTVS